MNRVEAVGLRCREEVVFANSRQKFGIVCTRRFQERVVDEAAVHDDLADPTPA